MDVKTIVEKTCRLIEPDLEKILNLPSLDNATLEKLNLLLDSKKNVLKIEKLEMEKQNMMSGYSNYYPNHPIIQEGSSNHYPPMYDRSYDHDGGYSRDSSRDYLEMAMRNARDDRQREEIRQLLSRM